MKRNVQLKAAIFDSGLTQSQLAKRARVPEMYVSLAVNGKYNLNAAQRKKIARALGRQEAELFPAERTEKKGPAEGQ
jgi:transcriptional regulator with XRE-family HTH domain